ncbi:MAG: FAD-dependent oxidoreductase [Bacteroidales bacterium]
MDKYFDHIIWGPSLEGIKKAIELKNQGKKILLAGKFGFPGGKASEALASLFSLSSFEDNGVLEDFLHQVEELKYGVLFRNSQWVLLHPEAVKRVCWQLINDNNIPVLFHIIPLEIRKNKTMELEAFGREGRVVLTADEILDCSDDRLLNNLAGTPANRDVVINSFFSDPIPAEFPGFNITRRLETPIGQFISMVIKNVAPDQIETTFNRELDRLSRESWKKHQARILMVPVYPEVK